MKYNIVMETLSNNAIFEFKPDTLQYVRKQYDLDNPERMNEAIDSLEEWISKQEHFEKKKFRRDYLERVIIYNKGSIEKCKKKLDKQCTLRSLLPDIYDLTDFRNYEFLNFFNDFFLTKMTPEHGRVQILKAISKKYDANLVSLHQKYYILMSEYLQTHDYCNHVTYVFDWRDGKPFDYVLAINLVEFRKTLEIVFEACSMRVKAMHVVTTSNAIDSLISIVKQILSAKLSSRIHIHKSLESLYEYIPKEIFPEEYGGQDKPFSELTENLNKELSSSAFSEYRKEMQQARTNEAYRQVDKFNGEYMGMPGTFRTLSVD